MTHDAMPAYGLWGLVIINTAVFVIFAFSFTKPKTKRDWRSFGAFSAFLMRKSAGPFFALAGVRTDVTGPALGEMLKEAAGMSTRPLSNDALNLAKDNLVRSLPGDFETDQSTVGSFATLYIYQLGLDYWAKYPALINAIDGATVQSTAAKYLAADRLHVVAVGDKAKILPQFEKLDASLGTPEIRDADGNVQKQ